MKRRSFFKVLGVGAASIPFIPKVKNIERLMSLSVNGKELVYEKDYALNDNGEVVLQDWDEIKKHFPETTPLEKYTQLEYVKGTLCVVKDDFLLLVNETDGFREIVLEPDGIPMMDQHVILKPGQNRIMGPFWCPTSYMAPSDVKVTVLHYPGIMWPRPDLMHSAYMAVRKWNAEMMERTSGITAAELQKYIDTL